MSIESPFPGLDPYLEQSWGDAHQRFVLYAADFLQERLPEDLIARTEERVYVESDRLVRSIIPDASIVEWKGKSSSQSVAVAEDGGVAVESKIFLLDTNETTEGFIEIREVNGDRVVTVIEFLSPTNKLGGEGTAKYRQKQSEVMGSESSLVEIDLVRAGRRVLALPSAEVPLTWRQDALALVRKGWEGNRVELFRMPLRMPLPSLPIPLRKDDAPVALDLQAVHDGCYRKGRYDRTDYSTDPLPPLAESDRAWAEQILAAAGKR